MEQHFAHLDDTPLKDRGFYETTDESFSALASSSNDAIVITDDTATVIFWNRAAEKITGYSNEDILGKPVFILRPPPYRDIHIKNFETYMETNVARFIDKRIESAIAKKNGVVIPVEISTTTWQQNGRPFFGVFITDISDRTKAKEHDILKLALKGGKVVVWEFDSSTGKFTSYGLEELFGYEKGYFKDASMDWIEKFIHPDDAEQVAVVMTDLLNGIIQEYDIEHRVIRKDGSLGWVMARGFAVCDEHGDPVKFVGTTTDITRIKETETDLNLTRSAVEQANDVIVIFDTTGIVQYVNPAIELVLGYSAREIIGGLPFFTPKALERSPLLKEIWNNVNQGIAWKGYIMEKRKNGSDCRLYITFTPIEDSHETIIGFAAIARDVTLETEAAEQLKQSQKMEAIGTFAGGIAHDFNNILASIIGYAEMGKETTEDEAGSNRFFNQILRSSQRARELIKQILTFSRKDVPEIAPVDPHLVFKEALRFLRASIPKTITIENRINQHTGRVLADPIQLHQILINLCANAKDAIMGAKEGGLIDVGLEPFTIDANNTHKYPELGPGRYAVLSVKDNGCGMDEGTREKIFDPFYTTKEKGQGTGMGLSVVHGIVKNCSGAIYVKSTPGAGTVFTVFFPLFEGEEQAVQTETDNAPLQGGTETILIVDDEKNIVELVKGFLEKLGYRVTAASTSHNALKAFHKNPDRFDLIITDLAMPNMSGFELTAKARKLRQDIPVMMITGNIESFSQEKAAAFGINQYLLKPLSLADIAKAVRRVLDENRV